MEINKSYYAVIPANVRYDKNICANSKLLYGEISALCNEKGFCWANNQYFQDLYEVGKNTVVRWINELINGGYILKNIEYAENGKTVLQRCLSLPNNTRGYQERYEGSTENDTRGGIKNDTYNNTVINNTINNTIDRQSVVLSDAKKIAFYLDNIEFKLEDVKDEFKGYEECINRIKDIALQVSKYPTIQINKIDVSSVEILDTMITLLRAPKDYLEVFKNIDLNPSIKKKFNYTVSMIYNSVKHF